MKFTRNTKFLAGLACVAIYAVPLLTINGTIDLFMKTTGGGIPAGEVDKADNPDFAGWIDIQSFSIGGANSVVFDSKAVISAKAALSSLSITREVDSTSPAFFSAMTAGTRIDELKLFLRRQQSQQQSQPDSFMKLYLKPAYVESIDWSGEGQEEPSESMRIAYGAIKIEYLRFDTKGNTISKTAAVWNQLENKASY